MPESSEYIAKVAREKAEVARSDARVSKWIAGFAGIGMLGFAAFTALEEVLADDPAPPQVTQLDQFQNTQIQRMDARIDRLSATIIQPRSAFAFPLDGGDDDEEDCIFGLGDAETVENNVLDFVRRNSVEEDVLARAWGDPVQQLSGIVVIDSYEVAGDALTLLSIIADDGTAQSRALKRAADGYDAAQSLLDLMCID